MDPIEASVKRSNSKKPHVVFTSWPLQGHFIPMMNLARLLHHKGFHITFVNTDSNHDRLLRLHGPDYLNPLPSFRFMSILDAPSPPGVDFEKDGGQLIDFTIKNCLPPLLDIISKLNSDSTNPPVTCIVSDIMMTYALDAAQHFGIPVVLLWTASACSLVAALSNSHLIDKGLIPIKDVNSLTNGYLDTVVEGIPGFEGILLKNFPHVVRIIGREREVPIATQIAERLVRASAIVLNTFDDLDETMIDVISSNRLPVYGIGPSHRLLEWVTDKTLNSIVSDLRWKEDTECLKWLDSKEPNSVIYVSIGSFMQLTAQQLVELAWGLANSNKNFLWVVRPDLVEGEDAVLPLEFVNETRERGLLTSWCLQEQVLRHPSIAGFLTHCGWNSMLESISAGVPMICWPFFADQPISAWYCCNRWGTGIELVGGVSRSKVEKLVVELMDTEKGREMKVKAMELKRKAEEAVGPKGSSVLNVDRLIEDVLLQ